MESSSGGVDTPQGGEELARGLWVKLALLGGDMSLWHPCIVCGAPTRMPYACQQTDQQGLKLRPEEIQVMRKNSPSGQDCWNVEKVWSWDDNVKWDAAAAKRPKR